jgi:chitosanase
MSPRPWCALVVTLVVTLAACAPAEDPQRLPTTLPFDREHKLRALELISVFENDTITLAYDYVEDLDDGRGYTCGLGFTTATGDALDVVQSYQDDVGDTVLTPFLPELVRLADAESDDTSGLAGFPDAWAQAADDEAFRAAQEHVQDAQSYDPAVAHARDLDLHSALGLMILFDTAWMHGDGDDDDGLPALIARTQDRADPADEPAWLAAFLAVRRDDLLHPADPATQDEWSEAVGRADALHDLVDDANWAFDGPIHVAHGYGVDVP